MPDAALPVHSITPHPGVDRLAVEPLGESNLAHPPHRHSFAQFILIDGGSGHHLIDFAPVPLSAGEVHVLAPGQVHSWEAEGLAGTTLVFSEDLLDGIGRQPEPLRELTLLGAAPLRLTPDALERVRRLLDALADTLSEESGRHLVAALLWECITGSSTARARTEQSSLSRRFLQRVLREPHARMTVSSCAAELGVTSGYLTECVVADTGATPGRILRTAVAREAQRLLSGTELSAAQISARLRFSEPSYFSRFFRREVGRTPTAYRALSYTSGAPERSEAARL